MRRIIGAVIIFGAMSTLGCGNNLSGAGSASASQYINPAIQNPSYAGATASTTSSYSCPNRSNADPNYVYTPDGSDFFTVCPSTTANDEADIQINGLTTSSEICTFPAVMSNSTIYWVPNAAGTPTYSCTTMSSGTTLESFAGITYNAVFIVESSVFSQMYTCLTANTFNTCPQFSYGSFR